MTRQREREEFVAIMTKEGVPFQIAQAVMGWAKSLHRLAEQNCNRGLTEREQTIEKKLQDRIIQELQPLKITPVFQDDPRGAVVKLRVPSGKTNDWGNIGICVP